MKIYKKYFVLIIITAFVLLPVISFAQVTTSKSGVTVAANSCSMTLIDNPKLADLLNYVTCIIGKSVIPLVFALAVIMFLWGVVQYVINTDEESKKAKGKQFMIWGIIALAVMVSVWGIVKILGNTFGIEYAIPQLSTK